MPKRHPFSWNLHALTQCLLVLSITVFSSKTSIWTRWSIFLPIAVTSCYLVCYTTTGDVTVDQGLGTAILIQLMIAVDYILITDVQRDIYPKDQPPRKKGADADIPLMKRFRRAISLYTTPRGIGWSFEPRTLPKPSTKPRFVFVSSRITRALASALTGTFASVMINSNPALSGITLSVRDMGWFYRTTGIFAFALNAIAQINTIHCVLAAFCVGVGISGPEEWPDLFGSPFDAYSVQRFWGRTWHQVLRRPLKSCTIFVVTKILHRPRDKQYTPLVFLNTVFLISGLVHVGGEYMMLGRLGLGAFRFFLVQGLAVSVETIVSNVFSLSGSRLASPRKAALSTPKLWMRIVGYVWVLLWFWWSLPFMVDPGILAGAYGPHRGLTFERLSKLAVNVYHRLTTYVWTSTL
ncbi:uncharacterized protein LACBIDRAFT_306530 [Laccaria bicolor S238N-H82]|uniref:Predicted protein n=1 Tax=Laccaria bicolor (strain S238N-H82 / ATCC MYA-4686) TaxID=486041 RepID=B0DN88_LACBS|nr:uncharacterized protein LACBIDRAFT_306530 [Laccaria bicolor S238N-H82]EDR03831.1 predicted protein [Laccaria bicolor S238N-H82]|eukprot:XP_001885399.1 predicted protein [Laccaria bicolor S238N-H82]